MQQKQHNDGNRDQRLLHQGFAERVHRFVNQERAIVNATNLDAAKLRFERRDLLLDIFNDGSRVLAVTHHDDATDSFGTV